MHLFLYCLHILILLEFASTKGVKEKSKLFDFIIRPFQSDKKVIEVKIPKPISEEIKRSPIENADTDTDYKTEQLDKLLQEMGQLLILDQEGGRTDVNVAPKKNCDKGKSKSQALMLNKNTRGIEVEQIQASLQRKENEMISPISNTDTEYELTKKKR